MENQQSKGITYQKFTWTIKDFSKLNTRKHYSEVFMIGGNQWRILIFPNGNNVDNLSIYLDVVDAKDLPFGWSRLADFKLTVISQINKKYSITKETQHTFNARENDWGFTSFIPLSELRNLAKGYLVNDTCIVEAEVSVPKNGDEKGENQATGKTTAKPGGEAGQMEVEAPVLEDQVLGHSDAKLVAPSSGQMIATEKAPSSEQAHTESIDSSADPALSKELPLTAIDELVDFRGLGQVEKAFVPLLEEVCSWYPSLVECQRKRSRMFTQWAFTALGRVLHYLKTTKVKDMTDDACEHLQVLWEELETFKFDLSWLEPHVQSALSMKTYLEKAEQVKKLQDNVAALEIEMKRLQANLAVGEVEAEVARRDLVKAEEGFEERDMNTELGYGRP
ncbi:Ubiquitin carboxyl-terminal hydrolase family protein [Quillaja saponaria]|uniref:Ubiquitin carboxyl-terminal hydrolase family protein n=1 Tax=Quillaja saponaria TaxID=32244 RepID=A0AAD7Q6V8_QUISA|nr:Ubiquitin carboxyl-terminal hydrolase family protein [Quillaja saponaria]